MFDKDFLGPPWQWNILFVLVIVGLLTVLAGLGLGIWWLCYHVTLV